MSLPTILTGKDNVGKTIKPLRSRFWRHQSYARSMRNQAYLYRAMRKHGIERFHIELIEEVEPSILNDREKYWIQKLHPEYNMTDGGTGGDTSWSPNYVLAISRINRRGANNSMWGRKRPDITADHMVKMHAGAWIANRCSVMCDGVQYASIGEAEQAYGTKNMVRSRLDKPNYPKFYRLREKTCR